MKAMAYIKKEACPDLSLLELLEGEVEVVVISLKEFQEEWAKLTPEEQETLREWARAEGKIVGVEIE